MTSQSVKPLTAILKPRREVLEARIEEALNLGNIYIYNELRDRHPEAREITPTPLYDSEEFLKRTYISEEMKNIILVVMGGLAGVSNVYIDERGASRPVSSRVIVVPSALGGGKTHLLATLYHIARLYNTERDRVVGRFEDKELRYGLKHVFGVLADRGLNIRIVTIVGDTISLAPSPDNPLLIDGYKIHTPWGLLGYLLDEYDKLRDADEKYRPPGVDELRKALRDKAVLILIDEAVEYMVRAVRLDNRYAGYSEAFLSFLRNLAQAVSEIPGAVLVLSIPVEFRGGVLGRSYQHPEYVDRIVEMVQRVGPLYAPPLVFEKDICAVFKKRLFENADSKEVKENALIISRIIKERILGDSVLSESIKLKYGDVSVFLDKLRESYPFHPYFIELAVNIALKNPSLGLTRYLLVFVSRLIKYIYDTRDRVKREPPLSIITPWIIPVDDTSLREYLLFGMISQIRSEFQRIYEQDVRSHSMRLEELLYASSPLSRDEVTALLNACITRTIWLSTIPGQGGKSADVVKLYIRARELPAVIYDPLLMREIIGSDIVNTLRNLSETSTYLTISHDDRVFYALIPDILTLLRQRYMLATDFDASVKLEKMIHAKSLKPGRLIKKIILLYTNREKEIEEIVHSEIEKDNEPALVIYLSLEDPPLNIVDLVVKRNNIALLLPDLNTSPRDLGLHYTEKYKRILGEDPPRVKEYLRSLLKLLKVVEDLKSEREHLRELAGEEGLGYVLEVLDKTGQELERHVIESIYSVLREVVIGLKRRRFIVDLKPFGEDVKDLSVLSRLLEESLEKRGVLTEWTWSSITSQLKAWSDIWDIDLSPRRPVRVGDIWSQLLYSPAVDPHLTSFDHFKRALEEAYLSNVIAFKHDETLIWLSHPYTLDEAKKLLDKTSQGATLHDWDRDVIRTITNVRIRLVDLEIVSPRSIIRDYVERLKKRAETRHGEKVIRRLLVYTETGTREFDEFTASLKSEMELVNALSRYPVVLVEETPSRVFQVHVLSVSDKAFVAREPVELEFEKTGEVGVSGRIESSEEFKVRVALEARTRNGELAGEPRLIETVTPGSFTISLPIMQPGEYIVYLRAEEPGGFTHPVIPVARVKIRGLSCTKRRIKTSELSEIMNKPGVEIKQVQIKGLLKRGAVGDLYDVLAGLGRYDIYLNGEVKALMRDSSIKVVFSNTKSDRAASVLRAMGVEDLELNLEICGLTMSKLRESRNVSSIILDQQRALSSLIDLYIEECVEV